jgi:phosphoglycolate phosphatase-like HAD superfamily hydrolase
MRLDGHDDPGIDTDMPRALARYAELLPEELAAPADARPRTYPGVHALLDALAARDDVVLGLLTGNVRAGAAAKLRAVGLDPERFVVGAFGSDHETRSALPAIARDRAHERLGIAISGADVVVIGDTPADIACGASLGVRAIGVATGHYSVAELRACQPAAVFANLADTASVLQAILNESAHATRDADRRSSNGSRA